MNLSNAFVQKKKEMKNLESEMMNKEVLSDPKKLRKLNESYIHIKKVVEAGEKYESVIKDIKDTEELLNDDDPEVKSMAEIELQSLKEKLPKREEKFLAMLVPEDPIDKKNVIIEIRAGTGGDESALFAAELFRLYSRYAEKKGWKTTLFSQNQNDLGGFKEIIFGIKGDGVYGILKYERGVHRVQRVPETEKQGRIHTSTTTVAVLPEVEEEDYKIDPKDLNIEATTSTGRGGQSVNTTYSAIRITHIPTGINVYCQDERSQKQNKERALSIIRARVFAFEDEKRRKEREEERREQIGTGERSEKIRTYNFPQDRLTDHRIGQNWFGLASIMDGDIEEILTKLKAAEAEKILETIKGSLQKSIPG